MTYTPDCITVYCDAGSHELWERTYRIGSPGWLRFGDGPRSGWQPDLERGDSIGGRQFPARHDAGIRLLDANGHPVDIHRELPPDMVSGRDWYDLPDPRKRDHVQPDDGSYSYVYEVRCPECGDAVTRSYQHLNEEFDWLRDHGLHRVSIPFLRKLRRTLDRRDTP